MSEEMRVLYRPSWVVELGHLVYTSDEPESNAKTQSCLIWGDFDMYRGQFTHKKDPEKAVYLEKLAALAGTVGSGKRRRREVYESRKLAIDKELELKNKKLEEENKIIKSLAKVGNMALFGGLGFALSKLGFAIAEQFGLDRMSAQQIEFYVTNGIALTGAVISDAVRHKRYYGHLERINKKHEKSLEEATREYRESVREEYRTAISRAQQAWRDSFGEEPPKEEDITEIIKRAD